MPTTTEESPATDRAIVPISQEELATRQRRLRRRLMIGAVVGLAVLIVVLLVAGRYVGVRLSLPSADPLAGVTVMDTVRPQATDPRPAVRRLQRITDTEWALATYGREAGPGGVPGLIADQVAQPQSAAYADNLQWLVTNVGDSNSTSVNGHLAVVISFSDLEHRNWLNEEPEIFADPEVEARRDTYWLGKWLVHYAPPAGGGTDHTEQLRIWLKQVYSCPTHARACQLDPATAEYDDWAPRAVE